MRHITVKKQIEEVHEKSAIKSRSCKFKNANIKSIFKYRKYGKMAILLRLTIENALNENIPKRRPCNQSKVWWSKDLTNKRKFMAYSKRQWKNSKI